MLPQVNKKLSLEDALDYLSTVHVKFKFGTARYNIDLPETPFNTVKSELEGLYASATSPIIVTDDVVFTKYFQAVNDSKSEIFIGVPETLYNELPNIFASILKDRMGKRYVRDMEKLYFAIASNQIKLTVEYLNFELKVDAKTKQIAIAVKFVDNFARLFYYDYMIKYESQLLNLSSQGLTSKKPIPKYATFKNVVFQANEIAGFNMNIANPKKERYEKDTYTSVRKVNEVDKDTQFMREKTHERTVEYIKNVYGAKLAKDVGVAYVPNVGFKILNSKEDIIITNIGVLRPKYNRLMYGKPSDMRLEPYLKELFSKNNYGLTKEQIKRLLHIMLICDNHRLKVPKYL